MDNFEKFIEYANEELDFTELTHETYDVDFIVEAEDLTSEFISEILQLSPHWGEGIDEAYIAINNVPVSTSNKVLMGSEASPTLKIEMGTIPAIKFRPTQEELDSLAPNDYTTTVVDLVARTNLNVWQGRETPQLFISEFKVVDTKVNF